MQLDTSQLGIASTAMKAMQTVLPSPGLAYGQATQRQPPTPAQAWLQSLHAFAARWVPQRTARLPQGLARAYALALSAVAQVAANSADWSEQLAQARTRLRSEGLTDAALGQALALAATALHRALGLKPYNTQVLAAWLMLNGRLVEMATGEGKTVAAALAAGVAGLAGTPVHVLTANDYLVQRDCDTLTAYYAALGLRCASVTALQQPTDRLAAWRADVVYSSASQLAFDHLRDHLALGGERGAAQQRLRHMLAEDAANGFNGGAPNAPAAQSGPTLPGLYFCLVDEADSILLDEAVMPLILAAPSAPLDETAYRRAHDLACQLHRQRDYTLHDQQQRATLTPEGRERINAAVAGAGGELHPPRRACELVEAALVARLLMRRERDYTVLNGELLLIDELTGRVAVGRQWQGALHPMVQIKEGLSPSAPNRTTAQISYQGLFPRYLHLSGMSGTLHEARHELRALYGAPVHRVPLAKAARRQWLGERCYANQAAQWAAVLLAVQTVAGAGRPVLVGTDSVAASQRLSALLSAAAVPHQLLNATQSRDEAQQMACAGAPGCVTVATNMAGRGTDIRLSASSRRAGGLHVIATQRNRSRRIDRQLLGRAARHGDPGSAQAIVSLDDRLLHNGLPRALLRWARWVADRNGNGSGGNATLGSHTGLVPGGLARPLFALAQRWTEWRDAQARRDLRNTDRQRSEQLPFSGAQE
jgi:preprotein translocase subunit SecA